MATQDPRRGIVEDMVRSARERFAELNAQTEREAELYYRKLHLLRVGDMVRVTTGRHHPDVCDKYPLGETGQIVGFAIKSVSRFSRFEKRGPGIYVDPEWLIIRFGDYAVQTVRQNFLELVDAEECARRLEAQRQVVPNYFNLLAPKIGDLPETEIWEGDIVRLKDWHWIKQTVLPGNSFPQHEKAFLVSGMDFGDLPESLDKGVYFRLSDRLGLNEDGHRRSEIEFELLEHGNVWRRARGTPLIFCDLAEEAVFFHRIGETDDVVTPGWSASVWPNRKAALQAVRDGLGHAIRYEEDFMDWSSACYYQVHRYRDEALGARLAKATLEEGFLMPSRYQDTEACP